MAHIPIGTAIQIATVALKGIKKAAKQLGLSGKVPAALLKLEGPVKEIYDLIQQIKNTKPVTRNT